MKKLMILLLSIISFFSCDEKEKNINNPEFIACTPGGCALKETDNFKSALFENDTLTYSVSDGKLDMMVGFNATCCGAYNTSSIIKNDTIFVNIINSQIGMCNCICYYTYTFNYSGVYNSYKYKVSLENHLVFTGLIEP